MQQANALSREQIFSEHIARARRKESGEQFHSYEATSVTPFGSTIIVPSSIDISEGDKWEFEVVAGGNRSNFDAVAISIRTVEATGESIAKFRFFVPEMSFGTEENRRTSRWNCSLEKLPKAVAAAPGKSEQFINFQVRNISADGLQLLTTLEHSYIVPGMDISLAITLPTIGSTTLRCTIVRARVAHDSGKEMLDVGVRFNEIQQSDRHMLGQYLIQFSNACSNTDLINEGLAPSNRSIGITFHHAKTSKEYEAVIKHRSAVSQQVRRGSESATIHPRDSSARIIYGFKEGEIVCSVRVAYPEVSESLESESFLRWRDEIARRDEVVEISGVSISPGSPSEVESTTFALLRYVLLSSLNKQRKTLVAVVPSVLSNHVEKAGFLAHGGTQFDSDHVFYGNLQTTIAQSSITLRVWHLIWSDVGKKSQSIGADKLYGADREIFRMYRFLDWLLNKLPKKIRDHFLVKSL